MSLAATNGFSPEKGNKKSELLEGTKQAKDRLQDAVVSFFHKFSRAGRQEKAWQEALARINGIRENGNAMKVSYTVMPPN